MISVLWWIIPIVIWEAVWKGIALWYSARRKQVVWFILIFLINSIGILPIVYLIVYRGKR